MTDGTKFTTRSTYGKPGDTMHLESIQVASGLDRRHRRSDRAGGQLAKFNRRFAGLGRKK